MAGVFGPPRVTLAGTGLRVVLSPDPFDHRLRRAGALRRGTGGRRALPCEAGGAGSHRDAWETSSSSGTSWWSWRTSSRLTMVDADAGLGSRNPTPRRLCTAFEKDEQRDDKGARCSDRECESHPQFVPSRWGRPRSICQCRSPLRRCDCARCGGSHRRRVRRCRRRHDGWRHDDPGAHLGRIGRRPQCFEHGVCRLEAVSGIDRQRIDRRSAAVTEAVPLQSHLRR